MGIRGLHLPLLLREKGGGHQQVLAEIDLSVELPHEFRSTHMSRFVEVLSGWSRRPLRGGDLRRMLRETCSRLAAGRADIAMAFKYFMEKAAPVSSLPSSLDYPVRLEAALAGDVYTLIHTTQVPIITLCPCSKEIAKGGAHSQRAALRASLRHRGEAFAWIEDVVQLLEAQGSAEVFPLLKRPDEKAVTERAWENAKFVEDVVRDAALALRSLPNLAWFSVECESEESIHNHNAYAYYEEEVEEAGPPGS